MGAMVSAAAAKGMVAAQQELLDLGAKALLTLTHTDEKYRLLLPRVILDVTDIVDEMPDEEHFGPLLKVIRYSDFDTAIAQANNTRFGLSAGLLSDSEADYQHFFPAYSSRHC